VSRAVCDIQARNAARVDPVVALADE
jgi:hypothetical protein